MDIRISRVLVALEVLTLAGLAILAIVSSVAGKYWVGLPIAIPLIMQDILRSPSNNVVAAYAGLTLYFLAWLSVPVMSIVLNRKKYLAINIIMFITATSYPCIFF